MERELIQVKDKEIKKVYEVFEEILFIDDNQMYTTYGVRHMPTNCSISDITVDKDKLTKFVELINESDLEIIHFADVIDDFLIDLQ